MTDPRIAALAEALRGYYHSECVPRDRAEQDAAAILAALPPDWCGHSAMIDLYFAKDRKVDREIARLRRIEEAARDYTVAVDADLHREGTPEDWWNREASLAALRAALEEKP